jgi:crotonobetainyl-CoA:carnitine CoA-transferase CaiB-like acyl-CoA transferase
VIKVESVTRPDLMRYTSTRPPTEDQWWECGPLFHGANNTKRGITIDLSTDDGRELFLRLVPAADVVLENFSPRVMQQFDLGWKVLHAANPRLVMVRLPAYGLDGPWRDRTGFAQTMEGITGMAWITGWPDGPPLIPRGACDPLAAMHAVFATMLALRDRGTDGDGHLVEMTMIEAALNAAAEQVVEHSATGQLLERDGNHGPLAAPQNVYACDGDEEWVAIAVTTDEQWALLRAEMGDPSWAADASLATVEGRRAAHATIDEQLSDWCAGQKANELAERLASHGVPAGYVIDARDTVFNPQMTHRGFQEVEDHPVTGPNRLPMVPFRFRSRTAPWMRGPSPTLGQHNDEVLTELAGLTAEELASLRERGVIGDRPRGL